MPVTVVVGGQFGSEGKGKVAKFLAEEMKASVAIRCGGPNSGHTVVDSQERTLIFKQLPTASILPGVACVLCTGSYIDVDILLDEIRMAGLEEDRLLIDENAVIITPEIRQRELANGLTASIGSTASGTGEAVIQRIRRTKEIVLARDIPQFKPYLTNTKLFLRSQLTENRRVILEGTQGFGLSLLHSRHYPKATSRDTSAAGFISEAGLSPFDVDDIVLTLRTFPIRVSGDSGPLPEEISWKEVTAISGSSAPIEEKTSVTQKIRRVGLFEASIVKEAISVNRPTRIILNHLDYIDSKARGGELTERARNFIANAQEQIGRQIDFVGLGPNSCLGIA